MINQSNCSLISEQPKSVVQACPMVNLWNFNMSMTPTWATAQPNRSGLWFTHAAAAESWDLGPRECKPVCIYICVCLSYPRAALRWSLHWWWFYWGKCNPPLSDTQLHTESQWNSSAYWPTSPLHRKREERDRFH